MKKFVCSIFLIVFLLPSYGYRPEPRPSWVISRPQAPKESNFVYGYGMGEGTTEREAEFNALKEALFYALHEFGLIGFEEESKSLEKLRNMSDVKILQLESIIPIQRVYQTIPILIDNEKVKIYMLVKVQKDKSKDIDFLGDANIEYESKDFNKAVRRYNEYIKKKRQRQGRFNN